MKSHPLLYIQYSSRSTEEIFSNFITIAFIVDSSKNMVKTFVHHYWSDACPHSASTLESAANSTYAETMNCEPNVAFLSLILMLGTLWLGVTLYEFTRTPFLNKVHLLGYSCKNGDIEIGPNHFLVFYRGSLSNFRGNESSLGIMLYRLPSWCLV